MSFLLGLKLLRFLYFQECWFVRAKFTKIPLFSGLLIFFFFLNNDTFSKIISAMEVLGMCLSYIKTHSKIYQRNVFFFGAQITQVPLFLVMSVLERSKVTVWEQYIFQKFFYHELFSRDLISVKKYLVR